MPWTTNEIPLTGATQAQLTMRNMSPDELVVVYPGPCDSAAFPAGSTIILMDPAGNKVFVGEAVLVQGDGSGNAEHNVLRAVGPWADLERLSYHDGTNLRLNIPGDLEGAPALANVADAVRHILERAIALGARFSVGDISLAGQMPAAQFDNTTCAAILIQLLRWSPGAICSWDYSSDVPQLSITRAAALPTLTIQLVGSRAVNVTPRTDFRVPGVRIVYRKKVISSYGQTEATAVDAAGNPDAIGGFVVALDLNPAQAQYSLQKTRVNVATVQPTSEAWWQQFGVPEDLGAPTGVESEGDEFAHYIKSGQLQSWMLNEINGEANAEPHGCTGPLSTRPGSAPNAALAFSGETPTTHIENLQSFTLGSRTLRGFWAGGAIGYELTLPVTDLSASGVYYRETLEAWDAGEAKPTGLASALFAAVSRLQYSGSIEVVAHECNAADHRPGAALNISGSAWSAMQAPVYQVSHEIMSGRTRLDFGPSPMWGAADLLELFRATRPQKPNVAELDPEEEPEPIDYRANSVNRATQGAGGSDGQDGEEGTVNVRIFKPTGDPGFDVSLVGWTITGTNGGRSGNGADTFALPAGVYSIVRFFPLGYVSNPTLTSPSSQFTVEEDSVVNTDIGVTEAKRLRLLRRLNGGDVLEIDSNVDDIPADKDGKSLKVRETDAVFMGTAAKCRVLRSEFYVPPPGG